MPFLPCYLFGGKESMYWWRWSWKSINWPSLTPFPQLVAFKFFLILRLATWILPWWSIVPAPTRQYVLTVFLLHYLYQMLVLHHGFDSSKRTFIALLSLAVKQSKGALICPQTLLKGAKTWYIYPIWMYDAIKGGLQPRPWHHGIIYTWQWPRIAKIWPSLVSVTV